MPQARLLAVASVLAITVFSTAAHATEPAQDIGVVPPPPQPYYSPPYGQPQPGYAPYPAPPYGQPQDAPVYPPPRTRRYREGDPVPAGYHLEEKPRSGLVTAGLIMVLVPYGIGVMGALAAKWKNESTWLAAPVVGPWLMMGARRYSDCGPSTSSETKDTLGCVGDVFMVMGLIISGTIQAAGATLFLVGELSTKTELVRDAAVRVRPMTIGSGYGLGLSGPL